MREESGQLQTLGPDPALVRMISAVTTMECWPLHLSSLPVIPVPTQEVSDAWGERCQRLTVVLLCGVCASVSGMWVLVKMSHFSCFPFYKSFQREWLISCSWSLGFIIYLGEKWDGLPTFSWLLASLVPEISLSCHWQSCSCWVDEKISFLRLSEMTFHGFCGIKL